jgi:hypothetical protein
MGAEIGMWRKPIIVLTMTVSATAQAECYVRSAMTNQTAVQITNVADVRPWVVPISPTQNKCIVNFRAQVNGEWITVEGENVGPKTVSEALLCKGAMDQGRTQILSRANGKTLSLEQNMVCTDQELPKIRRVEIGDRLQESEVLPHPNFPKRFVYHNATCRWFAEQDVRNGDLRHKQGIICRSHENEWQVVDKW